MDDWNNGQEPADRNEQANDSGTDYLANVRSLKTENTAFEEGADGFGGFSIPSPSEAKTAFVEEPVGEAFAGMQEMNAPKDEKDLVFRAEKPTVEAARYGAETPNVEAARYGAEAPTVEDVRYGAETPLVQAIHYGADTQTAKEPIMDTAEAVPETPAAVLESGGASSEQPVRKPYTSPYDVYRFQESPRQGYAGTAEGQVPYTGASYGQRTVEGGQATAADTANASHTNAVDAAYAGRANAADTNYRGNGSFAGTVSYGGPGGPSGPGGPGKGPEKKKGGKGKKIAAIIGLAALFGLVASLVFVGASRLIGSIFPQKTPTATTSEVKEPPKVIIGNRPDNDESRTPAGRSDHGEEGSLAQLPDDAIEETGDRDLTVPEVVELTMPSMVAITNTSLTEYRDFFGQGGTYENISAGSGIIVGETEENLLIATNDHVISDANKITVTFIDDSVIEGTLTATDGRNDLAIVQVKKADIPQETLDVVRVITIGDSDQLVVGETVVAIGNALGYGQSVSCGVVSALNREVEVDNVVHVLIQTDASINPGNSGGALINLRGELIGINEIKAVNTKIEGVGYAIPMATARPILENLGTKAARTKVDAEHASYIGIHCMTMPTFYVQSGYPAGAYVSDVMEGGPAEAAGLKAGDVITAIDGSTITSSTQLLGYLEYYAAGEKVKFTVERLNSSETAYEEMEIEITLGNRNDPTFGAETEAG